MTTTTVLSFFAKVYWGSRVGKVDHRPFDGERVVSVVCNGQVMRVGS